MKASEELKIAQEDQAYWTDWGFTLGLTLVGWTYKDRGAFYR